jgi:hypothetical protein
MVSVPSAKEPEPLAVDQQEAGRRQFPRFEYVADDELEEKTKARPRRRQRQRQPAFDTDWDDQSGDVDLPDYEDWGLYDDQE